MSESSSDSDDGKLREASPDYRIEFPVSPGYRDTPPKGSWEAGYRLSLLALELVKDRPEIFETRDRQRCDVEFVL